jgi:hypothetical protein
MHVYTYTLYKDTRVRSCYRKHTGKCNETEARVHALVRAYTLENTCPDGDCSTVELPSSLSHE